MNEDRRQRIWDEVIKDHADDRIRPDERTRAQLIKEYHLSRRRVDLLIKDLQAKGLITSRKVVLEGGMSCTAYSIVDLEGPQNE